MLIGNRWVFPSIFYPALTNTKSNPAQMRGYWWGEFSLSTVSHNTLSCGSLPPALQTFTYFWTKITTSSTPELHLPLVFDPRVRRFFSPLNFDAKKSLFYLTLLPVWVYVKIMTIFTGVGTCFSPIPLAVPQMLLGKLGVRATEPADIAN